MEKQQAKNDGLAIASMICGIVGLVITFIPFIYGIGIVPSIIGIVLGQISKGKIKRSEGQLTGLGMAKAGVICGIISTILCLICLVGCGVLLSSL